jgi:putative salt-induced outer membrane protein YdiY
MKLLIVAILPASQVVSADVLVLKNGDRISGEISRIWDSEVSIEPEYTDEFAVDLSAVDYIESDRNFEIELKDGTEIVGQFAGADSEGKQILTTESESVSMGLEALFELDEPEEAFDWDSNIEFSAALNSGNTESYNTKLRADGTVKFNDHRHLGEVTFFKEEQGVTVTQEQDLFKYGYNWLFRDPWFFSAQLMFERDPIIELESRVILSAGIGRDIWNTPRQSLSVQAGVGSQTEDIAMVTEESGVWIWSLRYRQDFFGDNLEVYHNNSIVSNFSGRANTSYKTTTGLRFEITDLLYLNLSLDYDYETDPIEDAENEDIALLIGLGAEF